MSLMTEFVNSDWFKSRPECIKELILKYPPNTTFKIRDKIYYLIGYSEGKNGKAIGLKLTEHNPFLGDDEYSLARKENIYVCLNCIENGQLCGH